MKTKSCLVAAAFCALSSSAQARYYDPANARFISADPFVENLNSPQTLNRYAYVRNNPLIYVDPLGLWRISFNFHAGPGGHFSYDSDKDQFRAGVGFGVGGGGSIGNDNWDVGYSNGNYLDVGYDTRMKSSYIEGQYGDGARGNNGVVHGYGGSGTYYFNQNEYVVGGGAGYGGFGVNGGYSSFGDGSYSVGASAYQVGATYNEASHSWNYSYTVDMNSLNDSYAYAQDKRTYNGYGTAGLERLFFVFDWLGTTMAGYTASDNHDGSYQGFDSSRKSKADVKLLTDMAKGATSAPKLDPNSTTRYFNNRILRVTVGLAIAPVYYGAVAIGGGPAYRAGHKK